MRTLFGAANGTAYRFEFSVDGAAPPGGQSVEVKISFVADSHAHLLATSAPLDQHLAYSRTLFGSFHVVQLVIDNELWVLPMTMSNNTTEVKTCVTTGERWPLQGALAAAVPPARKPFMPSRRFIRENWEGYTPRWDSGDPCPYDDECRTRVPPPNGYGPLSSRSSTDPNVVAHIPVYANLAEEKRPENYDDLNIEEDLPINVAFKSINFIRYVDHLPEGDAFPLHARLIDRRLAPNDIWSVSQILQTYFVATRRDPGRRMETWHLLTSSSQGLAGTVNNTRFDYVLAGISRSAPVQGSSLKSGEAFMKLLPIGLDGDYQCQPTSASPEASYILNHWEIVIEQEGVQHQIHQPLAQDVDWEDYGFFCQLAEMASAEGAPGRIKYVQRPYWYAEELSGVAVRLRDGGSRLPLEVDEQGRLWFQLPGDPHLHSKWGRFDGKDAELELQRVPDPPVLAELRVVALEEPHDVVFKVNETDSGDFHSLFYVLRARDSFDPVKRNDWLALDSSILEEWMIRFLLNLTKVTWGCLNRDLLRPPAAAETPPSNQPASALNANTSPPASESTSSKQIKVEESKKPRLA